MGIKHIPATLATNGGALFPASAVFHWGHNTLAGARALCRVLCLLSLFSPLPLAAQDLPVPTVDSAVSLGFTQSPPQEEKASPVTSPSPTPPLSQNAPTPSPAPLTPEQPTAPIATPPQDTFLTQEQRAAAPAPPLQEPSSTPLTQESSAQPTQEATAPRTEELSPPRTETQPTPAPLAVVEQRLPPMPDEVEQRLPATVPDTTPDTPGPAPTSTPAQAANAAASKDNKRLFGTIEMRASTKELRQWQDVQKRHADNPVFVPGFKLNASTSWDKLKSMLQDKPPLEKIRGVNSFWNQWPYKLDKAVYGKEDYWAAPYEFRKNSGDCEDYAITKYYTLKELGIPVEQMRIVVLKDTILNVAHAVLAVYLDDDIYILDNIAKNVLSHTRIRNYLPVYSVNEKYRWVHMRTSK